MILRTSDLPNAQIVATFTEDGDAIVEVWDTCRLLEIVIIDGKCNQDDSHV